MMSNLFVEFAFMVGIDLLFLSVLILVMLPLGIYRQAVFAVMKRNFVGYFSNPTGYVFLCLFVLLTSFAAFWPHEFFTTNLANFDQLNKFLPYIMLVFIPAITMSIWAEERQYRTDELLLTLPARDLDIVIGKYFAAVLIFSVSLIFSQLSNYAVLIAMTGGNLDAGLLFSTYLGYWFVGIAMLAVGMVASFLTNNLTVSFIFGVVFNAPLAFFSNADVIVSNNRVVATLYEWSLLQRFEPFGRGLVSAPSVVFFLGIVAIGVYLSMVLITRRHWAGGPHANRYLLHYLLRTAFLVITVIGAVLVVQHSPLNRLRIDVSQEKISTLSPNTRQLLDGLNDPASGSASNQAPIVIDAYVGNSVPTDFVQTKSDLMNLLREFDVLGGNRIAVNLHTGVEPFSADAILAERRFGIRPVKYVSESRGALREEEIILGAAFTSGLERVVVPFFDYGMPVEYELIRSINTVAQTTRKTVGIAQTDAMVMGGAVIANNQRVDIPRLRIIRELEKQYDVEQVDLSKPYDVYVGDAGQTADALRYDVLIVVQPSKTSPAEMVNLITAIQQGQPTIIFEDPLPSPEAFGHLPGTSLGRILARGATRDRADIGDLWEALGLVVPSVFLRNQNVPFLVWQRYNPYPRDPTLNQPEHVIVHDDLNSPTHFDREHPATAGLTELLFRFTGMLTARPNSGTVIRPLVIASPAGRIQLDRWILAQDERQRDQARGSEIGEVVLAAEITRDPSVAAETDRPLRCIYVADLDLLEDRFVALRDQPRSNGIEYRFENVTFVLNLVDALAGEEEYIEIRSRQPRHVTLRHVESTTKVALDAVDEATQNFEKEFEIAVNQAQQEATKEIEQLQRDVSRLLEQQQQGEPIDVLALQAKQRLLEQTQREQQERLRRRIEQLDTERQEKIRSIRLNAELEIQQIQRRYKLAAVLIPPIPPLLLGLIVFTRRRLREREGISKARRIR